MKLYPCNLRILIATVWKKTDVKKVMLFMLLFGTIANLFYTAFYISLNPDEREHLYSAYMVYHGEMPYRDFFQHHHPLMWYAVIPFLHFWGNSPYIWVVLRSFSLCVLLLTGGVLYKISYFIVPLRWMRVCVVVTYFLFDIVQIYAISFRPDQLMILFFLLGVYFFFCYVQQGRFLYLLSAYLLFLLSFLTLQKILLLLAVMGGIILFLPRKKRRIDMELLFLIIPLWGIFLFFYYWYSHGALKDYYELNWLLNLKLNILGRLYPYSVWYYFLFGGIFTLFWLKRGNYYLKAVSLLFLGTVACVLWYAPYAHYLLICYPFLALILVYSVFRILSYRASIVLFLVLVPVMLFSLVQNSRHKEVSLGTHIMLTKVVLDNSDVNDIIISNDWWLGGLRKNAYGYYWYNLGAAARFDAKYFRRHEFPDLNRIIREKRPKIVAYMEKISNCLTEKDEQTLDCVVEQRIDRNAMEEYGYSASEYCYVRQ